MYVPWDKVIPNTLDLPVANATGDLVYVQISHIVISTECSLILYLLVESVQRRYASEVLN